MGLGNNRIYVCAGTFTDHSAVLMAFSETAGISTNIHGSAGHADALNVMPSPAGQFVWVIGPEGFAPEAIVITDGLGRLVQRIAVQGIAAKTTIDISALPDGLYTVQAIDRSSRAFGRLIVAR